jgi:lysophospholipase L1-like esterase
VGGVATGRRGDLRDRRHGFAAIAGTHRATRIDPVRPAGVATALGARRIRLGAAAAIADIACRPPAAPFRGVPRNDPSVHVAETYGKAHHGRRGTVRAISDWAEQHDVPLVDLKAAVGEHVMSGRGNPDGIHWNFEAHQAVAELMLKALAEAGVQQEDSR